ncbi:MAG: hypothetical protein KJ720_18215 [Proteobacteria bacterium]|nr:hypothetical protein [Pseudomonadota bacterium]MBU2468515.1 hypothetical protein [Pseudomonadota bacterium]
MEGKKTTQFWDKNLCRYLNANYARQKKGAPTYNLLNMRRAFQLKGECVKRSLEWPMRRIVKAVTCLSCHGRSQRAPEKCLLYFAHQYQ